MGRRIDIELTSSKEDGTWTWRAAGAGQPRGVVDAKVLPSGVHVGDVFKVEANFDLDGIVVTSIVPTRERTAGAGRIEIATAPQTGAGSVTSSLVRPTDRPRRERPTGERGPRKDASRDRRDERRPRPGAASSRREGSSTPSASPRTPAQEGRSSAPPTRPKARTRPPRFNPGTKHRDTLLAELPAEQRPIAEQLAIGGLSGVRRAIAQEQVEAKASGRASANGEAIVHLAEQLVTPMKEANWLDRAEAAAAQLETISLRDLRITVTGASPRDDTGREILRTLRTALDERLEKLRTSWEHDIEHAIDEGRILHALRLSARPPEPSTRFPAALVERLGTAASAALTASTPAERWTALLEAAAASPLRRSVKPEGIPEDPTGATKKAATLAAGRIPSLAKLLGMAIPPPPRPLPPQPPRPRPARPPRETTAPTADAPVIVETASDPESAEPPSAPVAEAPSAMEAEPETPPRYPTGQPVVDPPAETAAEGVEGSVEPEVAVDELEEEGEQAN